MWRAFFTEAIIFSLTLLLGIFSALRIESFIGLQVGFAFGGAQDLRPSFPLLLFYLTLGAVIAFAITRIKKRKKAKLFFFRIIFFLAVFSGGTVTFFSLLGEWGILFLFLLLLAFFFKPLVILHNVSFMAGLAGAGALLGTSFSPFEIAVLMVLLSVYDVFAVYKTRHMVKMAKEMIDARAVMGVFVPFSPKDFFADLRKIKIRRRFLVLGGGDILIPLLFCVSFLSQGIAYAFTVFFFALLGLLFSFFVFIRFSRPIPALPPIVFFLLLGFLLLELEVLYHVGIF